MVINRNMKFDKAKDNDFLRQDRIYPWVTSEMKEAVKYFAHMKGQSVSSYTFDALTAALNRNMAAQKLAK